MLHIASAYFFAKMGEEVRRSNIQHTSWRRSTQKQYTTYILAKKYAEVIYNIHLGEEVRRSNIQHFTDVCCILLLRTSSPRCMLYITSVYFFAKMYVVYYFCVLLRQDVCCILLLRTSSPR
jgi:hypothetical protein